MRSRLQLVLAGAVAVAAASSLAWLGRWPGAEERWPGQHQARHFQEELRRCLRRRGIDYEPVVARPGSRMLVVEPPVPARWWAAHGGYGLVGDQRADVRLEVDARDPNAGLVRTPGAARRLAVALYGRSGRPGAFSPRGCFDQGLRAARFYEESRAGTLRPPTGDDAPVVLGRRSVQRATERFTRCMEGRGYRVPIASGPEGALRDELLAAGIILADGRPSGEADAGAIRAAAEREQRIADDDLSCRQTSGLDVALDRAWRIRLEEPTP